jgi:hypothetical protein
VKTGVEELVDTDEKRQAWACRLQLSENDFERLERLAAKVSFLPGLVAKLVEVARTGNFTDEVASRAVDLRNLWSKEYKSFENKAPKDMNVRKEILNIGRIGRPLARDFLDVEEDIPGTNKGEPLSRILSGSDLDMFLKSGLTTMRNGRLHLIEPDKLIAMALSGTSQLQKDPEALYHKVLPLVG